MLEKALKKRYYNNDKIKLGFVILFTDSQKNSNKTAIGFQPIRPKVKSNRK